MTDQENCPQTCGRMNCCGYPQRCADIAHNATAVIATSRRAWFAPLPAAAETVEANARQARLAHPLIRYAFDVRRSGRWRARIGRQAWVQSVVRFALERPFDGVSY